jgi:competence protein ComFC
MAMAALLQSARGWLNAGLGFLYPEICQLCNGARATVAESFVCGGCRAKVRFVERPFCERCGCPFQGQITQTFECANCRDMDLHFSFARAAVVAKDPVLDLIHRYKYHRALWFEPFLAALLIQRAQPELERDRWDWIVPVPLHPTKERYREFNQADRLGRRLGAATGIPLNRRCLRRVLPTRTQTQLSREERQANMRGAFAIRGHASPEGQRIVLVDDVLTTGATTSACARVLRAAGATEVCVWTLARGL